METTFLLTIILLLLILTLYALTCLALLYSEHQRPATQHARDRSDRSDHSYRSDRSVLLDSELLAEELEPESVRRRAGNAIEMTLMLLLAV